MNPPENINKNDQAQNNINVAAENSANNPAPGLQPGPINKSKPKRIILAVLIFLAAILIGGTVWAAFGKRSPKTVVSKEASSPSKSQFFGNDVSKVDCSEVMNAARDKSLMQSSKDKYQCFASDLTVSSEKVKYVNIQLTPEFESQSRSACSLDCGIDPTDIPPEEKNVGEFIVRQNGNVENYVGQGGGGLDSLLTELTGCGSQSTFGISDKLQNGTLVIDNNRLGAASSLSNLKVKDGFGNICTVDLNLVSYLTATGTWELISSVKINKIAIHYELQDAKTCADQPAPSMLQSCYTAQASLRSDVSLCNNLISSSPNPSINPGFDDCIIAVAKKERDPSLCDKIKYYREQYLAGCQDDTKKLKSVFAGEIAEK